MAEIGSGKDSEWNEGAFKSMRLHDCQNYINYYKRNLKGFDTGTKKYNYENWFIEVQNLRDEGDAYWSSDEVKEVNLIEAEIRKAIKEKPAHLIAINSGMGVNPHSTSVAWSNARLEEFSNSIREYERKVKRYNALHGLTTKTRDEDEEGL